LTLDGVVGRDGSHSTPSTGETGTLMPRIRHGETAKWWWPS